MISGLDRFTGRSRVRKAGPGDWRTVAGLYSALREVENETMNADAIGRYCLKILSSANHVVFLLMQEDTVVGQVMATEAVGDIDERFLSVYGLYVVPDYRRKAGVNDLLRACAEEARSRNLTSCEFILAPDNETLFYERIGCKLAGKVYRYEVTNEQQDVCG